MINRNFLLLWQGLAISTLGLSLLNVVGVIWLVEQGHSASVVGLLLIAYGLPMAFSMLLGGALADRFFRRAILVVADFCNGLVLLGVAGLFWLVDNASILVFGFFILQIILGTLAGFFMPAANALLPDILAERFLATGNAVIGSTFSVSNVLGRALGGILLLWLGMPVLLLIMGILFLLSALSEALIQVDSHLRDTSVASIETPFEGVVHRIVEETHQGWNYVRNHPGIGRILFLQGGLFWCGGVLMVTAPFLVEARLHQSVTWYGYLLAALSCGMVIGALIVGWWFQQSRGFYNRPIVLMLTLIITPLLCFSIAFQTHPYLALSLFFLVGGCYGTANVTLMTQLQTIVPNRIRGRVISIYLLISFVVYPLSGFIGGLILDGLDGNVVLVQWLSSLVGAVMLYPLLASQALWDMMRNSVALVD